MKNGFRWMAVALLLPLTGRAEDAPAKEEATFSPEVEKKFAEFLEKGGAEKAKAESLRFQKELADMVKITGLGEAGQKALETAGVAAGERAMKDWRQKIEKFYRTSWPTEITVSYFEEALAEIAQMVRSPFGGDYVTAWEQPVFQEALAQVLDPKQAATWKAEVAERKRKFNEETKGLVAATKARFRDADLLTISGTASAIAQVLSLDEERAKKLQKLGEQAADKTAEAIQEKARQTLLSFDEATRKQYVKRNNLYITQDEKDGPERQAVWTEGLKEILTPEEAQRWQTELDRRNERRFSTLARMCVWALDQVVAFTASQREQIRPLAEKWVREKKAQFVQRRGSNYSNYSVDSFYRAAVLAKDEDLQRILDAKQIARWKAACQDQSSAQRAAAARARVVAGASAEGAKRTAFEPEELENAISDSLAEMAVAGQKDAVTDALLQAEDAIRVAGVEGKAARRLETAARGAMEANLEVWRTNAAAQVRSQLQGATPADFQQRLANVGFNLANQNQRRLGAKGGPKGLWEKTVATELSEAQREAWTKETEAREADEQRTIVVTLLGELDRICLLTDEQRGQFEPLLTAHMKEYGPDFAIAFSYQSSGWFLMGYYMLTPVAGLGEKEVRKIVTDGQWKQLSGSQQYSNGVRYWENIETSHKQRVKEAEKK